MLDGSISSPTLRGFAEDEQRKQRLSPREESTPSKHLSDGSFITESTASPKNSKRNRFTDDQENDVLRSGKTSISKISFENDALDISQILRESRQEIDAENQMRLSQSEEFSNVLRDSGRKNASAKENKRPSQRPVDEEDDILEVEHAADILRKNALNLRKEMWLIKNKQVLKKTNHSFKKTPHGGQMTFGLHTYTLPSKQIKTLSKTQRRLLSRTLTLEEPKSKPGDHLEGIKHVFEMAQPKKRPSKAELKRSKLMIYAKYDDAKHCRFMPRVLHREEHKNNDDDEEMAASRVDSFVRRMENAERSRVNRLHLTIEEKKYKARHDKKECPVCGNEQSYDEATQKRKKCPSCGVEYRSKLAWGDISGSFLNRLTEDEVRRKKDREEMIKKSSCPFRMTTRRVYDSQEKTIKEVTVPVKRWENIKHEFFERYENEEVKRLRKQEKFMSNQHGLESEYTFMPALSEKTKLYKLGTFAERTARDIESRVLRQQEYELSLESKTELPSRASKSKLAKEKTVVEGMNDFENEE